MVSSACTIDRVVATALLSAAGDGGALDAGPDELTLERQWGAFAESLPLPPCADGGVLVVNTLDDTLEGGPTLSSVAAAGPTLSFREALFVASNRAGPDRIHFDATVFPPNVANVIRVTDALLPFPRVLNTCIDARGRGVIVQFDYLTSCETCSWSLGSGSQLSGLVLKGRMGKLGVDQAVVAGNRFSIAYQALQISDGAVIGPWNVFGHGAYGVRLDFYFLNLPSSIEGNFFGVEPTTHANLDLTVGITAFEPVRIADNLSNSTFQVLGTGAGVITQNQLRGFGGFPSLTVQGEGWSVSQNVLEGGVNNSLGNGPRGNSFSQNTFAGELNGDGKRAPPTDAGLGSIGGTCPENGAVEISTRSGASWVAIGTTACTGSTWSFSSSLLVAGVEARTLFTPTATLHTGPSSAPLLIPGTR